MCVCVCVLHTASKPKSQPLPRAIKPTNTARKATNYEKGTTSSISRFQHLSQLIEYFPDTLEDTEARKQECEIAEEKIATDAGSSQTQ